MAKELLEKLRRTRKYASFYAWPNQKFEERAAVDELLRSMLLGREPEYSQPISSANDPPDCVLLDRDRTSVAMEITELVSKEAIQRNQRGENIYCDWNPNEVAHEVNRLISHKDGNKFHGGPYTKKVLLIFTDEITLQASQAEYAECLAAQSFGPVNQIDEAYFLFPYDGDRCPYIKLRLNRSEIAP